MSLLTLCQETARDIGLEVPSLIVGSTDETAVRLLAQARKEGKALAKKHPWAILQTEHTFSTVASQASYTLPTDFHSLLDDTVWDRTNFWRIRGPLTPGQWQHVKSSLITTSAIRRRFRIKVDSGAKKFFIDPTPTTVDSLVFEYLSNGWVQKASDSTFTNDWTADGDTTLLDEDLIEAGMAWRILKRLGIAYFEERDEYDKQVDQAIARDGGAGILNMGEEETQFLANVPENNFG